MLTAARITLVVLFLIAAPVRASILDQLGLTQLKQQLGRDVPTGRNVEVGHVVGSESTTYLPNVKDARFKAVHFIPHSGDGDVHGHAQGTCAMIYGAEGLAHGVTDVHVFAVRDWFGRAYLNVGLPQPQLRDGIRLFNHSWISDPPGNAAQVLYRVDDIIERRGVIMVAAVNNNARSRIPALLASAYNTISVGHYEGKSSGGRTRVDGADRCKPDLVAPGGLTSFATAAVTGMTARLIETADAMGAETNAAKPEVIKAVLLAGCEKPSGWTNDPEHPLADHYGAGRIRIDNSYHLLRHGPTEGVRITSRYGWQYPTMQKAQRAQWLFDAPAGGGEVSIVAVWHRRVEGGLRMADVDLQLQHIDDAGEARVVGASRSKVDNVEHVYLKALAPGRYVLTASRVDQLDEAWPVAVAWRVE